MVEAAAAHPSSADVEALLRRYPELGTELLAKMRGIRPVENSKRGIDFGLGRGYSGNQAAKHFMGLVASQYAGGPGKRKRSGGFASRVQPILYDDGSRGGVLFY